MDINKLCEDSYRYQKEKGWVTRTVGEDIALMHSELSEALEVVFSFRNYFCRKSIESDCIGIVFSALSTAFINDQISP